MNWVSWSARPLESSSSSSCRWWDAASAAAAAAGTAAAACTRSRAGGWAAGAGRSGPLSCWSPLSSCECAGREAPDGTQGWLEMPALGGRARKLPLFSSRSRHGGTKERKRRRWEAGPGGLRIGTVQTFPDSFPAAYWAPPCLSFWCPSSLVPQCRALAGMHWKQGSLVCSRPCRLGSVWVDLEGTGGEHWD